MRIISTQLSLLKGDGVKMQFVITLQTALDF